MTMFSYEEPPYCYAIKSIVKYIDGDTIDVILDLGFHIHIQKRIRLYGINTPETRTRDKVEKKKGLEAKERLIAMCEGEELGESNLILKCHGLGKYGRVLGTIYNNNCNVNRMLVLEGYAVEYLP